MGFWDDNATLAKSITESKFIKFAKIGDAAEGVITAISTKDWPAEFDANGVQIKAEKTDVVFDIRTADGRDRVLTASTADLKEKLVGGRADVGDHVTVELVAEMSNKRKIFKVDIKRGVPTPAAAKAPALVPAGQAQKPPF